MKKLNNTISDFSQLVANIQQIHTELSTQVSKAVNVSLTLRNWLIGMYIHEYELNGSDRAAYGEKLLENLANNLKGLSNCNKRQLYRYHQFYELYPQIVEALPAQFKNLLPANAITQKVGTAYPQLNQATESLVLALSYSHFELLINIDDDTKRAFYEIECLQSNWSVRELKRQINSLYYERSGLSLNKEKLSILAHKFAEPADITHAIRDPYVFEFLGLKAKEVMSESHLENELLNNIEEFLLELGHGFCFEAKQKRIVIGEQHYFIDLVFYHRILKCHILVELKLAEFNHENIGQLNTYLHWYKKNVMTDSDNPPIGILLCTDKNHALVEYALAGMDNQLFVSQYQLALPKKEEMQKFIEDKLRNILEI
jgi:predicted nuclease of restriction endonuclease-like (RecB) superfamily